MLTGKNIRGIPNFENLLESKDLSSYKEILSKKEKLKV